MKSSFVVVMIALVVWACSPAREISNNSPRLAQSSRDSTEYEILIIDLRFDQWYLTNYNQAKDHSNEYYRIKNNVAVANWNDFYRKRQYGRVIDTYIDYQPGIDYGIEVNRKLYWYFRYLVSEYRINLFGDSDTSIY